METSNPKSGKPWKLGRGQKILIFRVSVALLGGGPKIFLFERGCLIKGGSRRSLIPLCILCHRKGQPSVWRGGRGGDVHSGGVGSILLYIGELDGDSTLLGGRIKKIGLNRRALPTLSPLWKTLLRFQLPIYFWLQLENWYVVDIFC